MKPFQITQETVAQIQTGLAELAAAADSKRAADAVLAEKVEQRDAVAATAERLADCDPNDSGAISQLITARTRLPLFPRIIAAAQRVVVEKVQAQDAALAGLSKAVTTAVKEIAQSRKEFIALHFAKVTDEKFGAWAADYAPSVSTAANLGVDIGRAGLPTEALAQMVMEGRLPDNIQRPQGTPASLVILSNSPARNVSSAGPGGYTHVSEQRGGFVIR
jgi:hypothetical protein